MKKRIISLITAAGLSLAVSNAFAASADGITVKGDVNADGRLTIADAVSLHKWLLAVPNAELADWKAADFNSDGTIDIFDFCLLRRELIVTFDRDAAKAETEKAAKTKPAAVTPITAASSDLNGERVDLRDFYEEMKEYSEEAAAKYSSTTADEVYKHILGNYVILSNESGNKRDHLLVMDENAKLHGMVKIQTETCVKVKSGTELTDIPSAVRYRIKEDEYILKSDDMNAVNEYVGTIKNNGNVLAIDDHYGIYEDTINNFMLDGFRYDGDELTEEFFADYPHLGLKSKEIDTKYGTHSMYCQIDKNAEPGDIFKEMVKLKEAVSGIDAVFIQTEAWLETPVMYYCNSPVLTD